jgi:alkylated DNA repair protein alkB homolog 6
VLAHRRLQTWPGDLTKDTLFDSPLPEWLTDPVIPRLLALSREGRNENDNVFADSPHHAPNHILINEYLPGQGIMPHKDGSAYHPVVCTVSLGSSLCLDIYGSNRDGSRESNPRWRIFQEPRSLLVTTGDLYTEYLHGIADVTEDVDLREETIANWSLLRSPHLLSNGTSERQTRISLTYRDVLKVSRLGNKIGIFGKR